MSVSIKYKGAEIASANTDITKTLKTSGKYCEGDIEIINTQDGGGGITPTGNINITTTQQTDVTNYATAQVVDTDLIASNIKKDVNILGVVGSFEGGGGGLPSGITVGASGEFTVSELTRGYTITHNLGKIPKLFMIYADAASNSWYVSLNTYTIYSYSSRPGSADISSVAGAITTTTNNAVFNNTTTVTSIASTTTFVISTSSPRGGFQPSQIVDDEGNTEIITYKWFAFA